MPRCLLVTFMFALQTCINVRQSHGHIQDYIPLYLQSFRDSDIVVWEGRRFSGQIRRIRLYSRQCRVFRRLGFGRYTGVWEIEYPETEKILPVSLLVAQRGHGIFGRPCASDDMCLLPYPSCIDGACACKIGYSLNVTAGDCVEGCERYGKFFTSFESSGIDHYNTRRMRSDTLKDCTDKCRAETRFVCKHAEFKPEVKSCNLSNTTWFEVEEQSRHDGDDEGWILSIRHCLFVAVHFSSIN